LRIKVDYAFIGHDLKLERDVCIDISSRGIESIEPSCRETPDLYIASSIAIPPLCNAHTHPMDVVIAEYGEELELHQLVSLPNGLKYRKLAEIDKHRVAEAVTAYLRRAVENGVILLAAIAEFGDLGIEIFKEASTPWIAVDVYPQAHPDRARDLDEYLSLMRKYRRLSMDTLLSLSLEELNELGRVCREVGARIQVHVSETQKLFEYQDYTLLKHLESCAIPIHLTYLTEEIYEKFIGGTPLVICPRSNANHLGRLPEVSILLKHAEKGYAIGIGSDNGAWFTPSPLEEMHYAFIAYKSRVSDPSRLAKTLLYAATIGCFRVLGSSYRGIDVGSLPIILVLVDPLFSYTQNPVIAIARRGVSAEKLFVIGNQVVPLPSKEVFRSKLLHTIVSSIAPSH